jgi:RNA polymerase sigma-70 factor (ECF subfamily)
MTKFTWLDCTRYAPNYSILNTLPNEQKRLIELAFFNGLDNRQIAEVSTMPVSTVKSTIRQVLLQLKGVLMN